MKDRKLNVTECLHQNIRSHTFKDGKEIKCCYGVRAVTNEEGKFLWKLPCTEYDKARRKVLCPRERNYDEAEA